MTDKPQWRVIDDPDKEISITGLALQAQEVRYMLFCHSFTPGTIIRDAGGRQYEVINKMHHRFLRREVQALREL